MVQVRAADPKSLEGFVAEHYAMVVSFLTSLVVDSSEANDLAQEVFITAWKKMDKFDADRPAGPWLRGIARNLARNAARRSRPVSYPGEPALEWLDGMYSRIESRPGALWQDKLEALEKCLSLLKEEDGRYVAMHYEQRRTYEEISSLLRTSVENVRKKLYRIRRRLGDCALKRLEVVDAGT